MISLWISHILLSFCFRLLLTMTVSHFPSFWSWEFSVVLVRYFVQCLSVSNCIMFFSWLEWVMAFGQEDHRGKIPFLLFHIKDTYYQHVLLLMLAFVRFSTVLLLFCPLSYCIFWKEKQPQKGMRVYVPFPWGWNRENLHYLQIFCMEDLSLLSQLFIQSRIYIYIYSRIFILHFEL